MFTVTWLTCSLSNVKEFRFFSYTGHFDYLQTDTFNNEINFIVLDSFFNKPRMKSHWMDPGCYKKDGSVLQNTFNIVIMNT